MNILSRDVFTRACFTYLNCLIDLSLTKSIFNYFYSQLYNFLQVQRLLLDDMLLDNNI